MPYNSSGNYVSGTSGSDTEDGVSQFDQGSADIPIWGWLTGATARRDQARQQAAANANRGYFDALNPPSADQLMGSDTSRAAQMSALNNLGQWTSGQLTRADRQGLESIRGRDMQASGAQQRGLMQEAQARGVGGSGLDYATRQQAAQAGQQQASDAESQMLNSAQQRALGATTAIGQLGSQMRGQDQSAQQAAWQGQLSRAAGATGQYSTDSAARQGDLNRRDQETSDALGGLGSLLASL